MKPTWVTDYDMHEDKCYKRPGCPKCNEPIFRFEDNQFHCASCGDVFEPDAEMLEWYEKREEMKMEIEDHPEREIEMKNGEKIKMGCGGKECLEVYYRRNPITLEWITAYGHCNKCGMRFIV